MDVARGCQVADCERRGAVRMCPTMLPVRARARARVEHDVGITVSFSLPVLLHRQHAGTCSMAHRFTVGVEEEFQIVDPDTWELRSHVSELLASSAPVARRSDQARDAPVDRRGRHEDLRGRRASCEHEIVRIRRELCRRRRARRPAHRRRRHASVLALDGSGHLARRALREHRRGAAAARALAADLRPARPRRGARSHERRSS